MPRPPPAWIVLVFSALVLANLADHLPAPPSAEVLARARELGVERDPRRMSARELRQLPGVGEVLARVLADVRDAHRAPLPLWLEDVPGIGDVRAREIRAWCRARGVEPDPLQAGAGYPELVRAFAWSLCGCVVALATGCGGAGSESRAPAVESPDTVRTVTLRGGTLFALECGPAGAPVVLLLHGGRYTARTWAQLGTLAALGRRGYHAVALDWPGHGATPDFGTVDAGGLLRGVCDDLGAERVALVAASLGGGFALEFLGRYASRVAALCAIAPAGADAFQPGRGAAVPTLLMWGEDDEVLSLERGRALAERLPGARLEVFPGASHACYLDQPDHFHALLLAFLAASLPPAGEGR
jgi:abhydrolase domain-containing protein 14